MTAPLPDAGAGGSGCCTARRRRTGIAFIAGAVLVTLAGCQAAGSAPGPPEPPGASAPARLSETGLYDAHGAIDARNLAYLPQYPLWTDGAAKSRWIYLPAGSTIDVADGDVWKFPAGTKFWKQFSFAGRPVETRMIWKPTADTWLYASYVWNEDQTDALLAPPEGIPGLVEIAPGKRHSIPSIADCGSCHASAPAIVLGFNALQLSDDRDPLAPHGSPLEPGDFTLRNLEETGRLQPARPEWVAHPPRIRASTAEGRAALGYLSANCGGCHNSTGPLARLDLDLLHDVNGDAQSQEPALLTALNARGRFVMPGVSADRCRIVAPGAPAFSSLLYRMKSRRPSSQMPPLGTVIADDTAIALVQSWIAGLDSLPSTAVVPR